MKCSPFLDYIRSHVVTRMMCLVLAMLLIVLSSPGCVSFFRRNTPTLQFRGGESGS